MISLNISQHFLELQRITTVRFQDDTSCYYAISNWKLTRIKMGQFIWIDINVELHVISTWQWSISNFSVGTPVLHHRLNQPQISFFFYSLYYRTEIGNVSVKKQQGEGEKREQVGYRWARILLPVESSAVHQNSRRFLPPLSQPYHFDIFFCFSLNLNKDKPSL